MTGAQPQYWFGIPRNVSFPGLVMDIDRYASIAVAKDNSPTVGYVKQSGMRLSAYEHLIPEKLFTDPNDPNRSQGVSAVKAIALAVGQGQKIYTLNQANQSSHATLLAQVTIDASARQEIQNALAAGKEVTVHQSPITQSGWTGSGYIITDPGTGAGAYKISGGANGAFLRRLNLDRTTRHDLSEGNDPDFTAEMFNQIILVYLPPTLFAGVTSLGGAADKRYSLVVRITIYRSYGSRLVAY